MNVSWPDVGIVDPSKETWVRKEEHPMAPHFCGLHTLAGPDNYARGRRLLETLEKRPRYKSHKPTEQGREEPKDFCGTNEAKTEDDFGSKAKALAQEDFSWAWCASFRVGTPAASREGVLLVEETSISAAPFEKHL
jgi:hypothetical protein